MSLIFLLLTSCATTPFVSTPLQQKLNDNKEQILDASKILIGKVDSIMESQKNLTPDLIEALKLLKKAQAAMGVTEKDKQVLADVQGVQLSDYVNHLTNKVDKLQQTNEELEKKIEVVNNNNEIAKIQKDAVDEDHAKSRHKWYAILASIGLIVGLILYYVPSSFTKMVLGGIGTIFGKKKTEETGERNVDNL